MFLAIIGNNPKVIDDLIEIICTVNEFISFSAAGINREFDTVKAGINSGNGTVRSREDPITCYINIFVPGGFGFGDIFMQLFL